MNIDSRTEMAQSFLIGQLSRAKNAPRGFGSFLLDLAFKMLNQARDIVGCRIVRVDCHDPLIQYYEAHGFRLMTKNDEDDLNQMASLLNDNPDFFSEGEITLDA